MKIFEAAFDIGDEVTVHGTGVDGKITSIIFSVDGTQYRVVYWYESQRYEVWMNDFEITPKQIKK